MIKKLFIITLIQVFVSNIMAQGGWSWNTLPNMPFKTSNNTVTSAKINDTTYVYTFLGIDTTKQYNGIHTKSARYNTITQLWDTIPNVPDSLGGLIAAGASTIKNKIIIIGGYHVYSGGSEISAKHVHIFDPSTNTYSRGKDIPIEIDDHVQISYKDSLIYVITGWSSSIGGGNNSNAVQVYDAINDNWYSATSTPNTTTYKVFGASGTIINDTIYYAGGARASFNFPLIQSLRKGVIDSSNPLNITWTLDTVISEFKPYRANCVNIENKAFWIGGSSISYNYDGLAYSNNNGVNPNNFITEYNNSTNKWAQYSQTPFDIMDLRGIAKIDYNKFIICGGMTQNQEVINSVFELTYDTSFASSTDSIETIKDTLSTTIHFSNELNINPNPFNNRIVIQNKLINSSVSISTLQGKLIYEGKLASNLNIINSSHFSEGTYIVTIQTENNTFVEKLIKSTK